MSGLTDRTDRRTKGNPISPFRNLVATGTKKVHSLGGADSSKMWSWGTWRFVLQKSKMSNRIKSPSPHHLIHVDFPQLGGGIKAKKHTLFKIHGPCSIPKKDPHSPWYWHWAWVPSFIWSYDAGSKVHPYENRYTDRQRTTNYKYKCHKPIMWA